MRENPPPIPFAKLEKWLGDKLESWIYEKEIEAGKKVLDGVPVLTEENAVSAASYDGNYADIPEFRYEHDTAAAYQAIPYDRITISDGEKILVSRRFNNCQGLILQGQSGICAIFHLWPGQESREEFLHALELFLKNDPTIKAIIVRSSQASANTAILAARLDKHSVPIEKIIEVDNEVVAGEAPYAISYRPGENVILFQQSRKKKLLTFEGFKKE